jgi:dTDP-4-dehydrorhamnose reductase
MDVFAAAGTVTGYTHDQLDVADAGVVRNAVLESGADLVLNAAAYTDVEGAEDDADAAFRTNEAGAQNVAEACAHADRPLMFFSTDFVFDGDKRTPYEPDDPIDPSGVYAESKAAGEMATRKACPRHFIVRTAWLYGMGGNNFVEKILRAAELRPSLKVVEDEIGSPTYTHDLAEATLALCATTAYGTYHAVNAGACSRFEYARAILRLAGVSTPVEPCSAAEFPTKAPRPAYSVLSNAKLEAVCGFRMPAWEDALARYLIRTGRRK